MRPSVRIVVRPSVWPSVRTVVRPSVRPSVRTVVRPSVRTVVRPSVRTVVRPSVRTVVRPPVRTVVRPSVRTVVRPSVRTVVRPSIRTAFRFWRFFPLKFSRTFSHTLEMDERSYERSYLAAYSFDVQPHIFPTHSGGLFLWYAVELFQRSLAAYSLWSSAAFFPRSGNGRGLIWAVVYGGFFPMVCSRIMCKPASFDVSIMTGYACDQSVVCGFFLARHGFAFGKPMSAPETPPPPGKKNGLSVRQFFIPLMCSSTFSHALETDERSYELAYEHSSLAAFFLWCAAALFPTLLKRTSAHMSSHMSTRLWRLFSFDVQPHFFPRSWNGRALIWARIWALVSGGFFPLMCSRTFPHALETDERSYELAYEHSCLAAFFLWCVAQIFPRSWNGRALIWARIWALVSGGFFPLMCSPNFPTLWKYKRNNNEKAASFEV